MNIAFYTLGCKVNQFETQALALLLSELGHNTEAEIADADVIVINTCTVTAMSDQKSRRAIRHLQKTCPHAKIAVCGCLTQINPESVRSIPGVSLISGTANRREFAESIHALCADKYFNLTLDNPFKRRTFEVLPAGGISGHTRAMLKIEDGCSNFCSYCIIPYSRGPVRSMPFDEVIKEAGKLSDKGYREVVVTGIEISSYGRDLDRKPTLSSLISKLCHTYPDMRIRLGSIEPRTITDDFCKELSNHKNLCPQFHLSMQSGCDATLSRMKRKYDTARFFESVSLLRKYFPNCAVTTDMIVGFPGETENEFSVSLKFIEKCNFSSMHIFPYSQRAGTPAATMPNQLTKSEKSARVARATEVADRMKNDYLKRQTGSRLSVLFEEICDGLWCGHSKNYVRVYVESDENLKNKVLDVFIDKLHSDGVFGHIE